MLIYKQLKGFIMASSISPIQSIARFIMLGVLMLTSTAGMVYATPENVSVNVWKDPNCGCCSDWVKHLESQGFTVQSINQGNQKVRAKLGVSPQHGSCHTAVVEGYVIEGHVPAADIRRLLLEKPAALGLAVPGMPIGSPGMDGEAYGDRRDKFNVLLIQKNGQSTVFSAY